jgi:hypothetical protein
MNTGVDMPKPKPYYVYIQKMYKISKGLCAAMARTVYIHTACDCNWEGGAA